MRVKVQTSMLQKERIKEPQNERKRDVKAVRKSKSEKVRDRTYMNARG